MKWKAGLKIFVALALLFTAQSRLSVYIVEEALSILLGIAAVHVVLLLTGIAFLLLWHGAVSALLQLKKIVGRISNVRNRPLALNRH